MNILVFRLLIFTFISICFINISYADIEPISGCRHTDPTYKHLDYSGIASLTQSQIKDGKASHLSPAEIIYYAAHENYTGSGDKKTFVNPVLLMTFIQTETSLIERGKSWIDGAGRDFEKRLYKCYTLF